MDNSYIREFINSKDICKHLEDIDYQFSTPEYAYLIWQSREYPILQRHEEFKRLIDSTESSLIKTSGVPEGWDLHQTIREYIALENNIMQRLFCKENSCFYVCEWLEDRSWNGGNCYFGSYEDAYTRAMEYANENNTHWFRIQKRFIDGARSRSSIIEGLYNTSGNMMEIEFWGEIGESLDMESGLWAERFDEMWFDIPIPFKPGDIVCDCYDKRPFVITTTVPWYRKAHPPKNASTLHLTNMDMCASGYTVDDKNMSVKYNWMDFPYMNLEYYPGDLSRSNRILYVYSLFKQNKINGDTLIKLVQLIKAEWSAEKYYKDIDWMFDEEMSKNLDIDKYKEMKNHE